MDDKYQQLIEQLASKLGVTAEHLWGVLVRQAPISGAVDLLVCAVMLAITVWWVPIVKRKTIRPPRTEADRYPNAEWVEESAFLAWGLAVIAIVSTLVCVLGSVQEIVAAFTNPEYWALMKLMSL